MTDLLIFIFQTHLSTWDDYQQLLLTLFNTEECHHILDGAQTWLKSKAPSTVVDLDSWVGTAFPQVCPNWDCNMTPGHEALDQYCTSLFTGLKEGGKKPINM